MASTPGFASRTRVSGVPPSAPVPRHLGPRLAPRPVGRPGSAAREGNESDKHRPAQSQAASVQDAPIADPVEGATAPDPIGARAVRRSD